MGVPTWRDVIGGECLCAGLACVLRTETASLLSAGSRGGGVRGVRESSRVGVHSQSCLILSGEEYALEYTRIVFSIEYSTWGKRSSRQKRRSTRFRCSPLPHSWREMVSLFRKEEFTMRGGGGGRGRGRSAGYTERGVCRVRGFGERERHRMGWDDVCEAYKYSRKRSEQQNPDQTGTTTS